MLIHLMYKHFIVVGIEPRSPTSYDANGRTTTVCANQPSRSLILIVTCKFSHLSFLNMHVKSVNIFFTVNRFFCTTLHPADFDSFSTINDNISKLALSQNVKISWFDGRRGCQIVTVIHSCDCV